MNDHALAPSDKRHRFPPEISGHTVWRSFRFALSYRDVEALLAERGAFLTDETVRQWCRTSCAVADPAPAIRGTWLRSSSPATACRTSSGAPSIRTGMCALSWGSVRTQVAPL